MSRQFDLPPYLEVRYTTNYGRGVFTKKPIERGTKLFTGRVHAFGVGGVTVDDVRSVCHHCLAGVSLYPIVCRECRIISYCSTSCLEAARPLHAMECKGIKELEKCRGKVELKVDRPSFPHNYTRHWPPVHALLVARVINKSILDGNNRWIDNVCYADTLPPSKSQSFPMMEEFVRPLVPSSVTDEEIKQAFRVVSVNAGGVGIPSYSVSVSSVYNVEYLLLNHMCRPNCESEPEDDGTYSVYAIYDLEAGEQLGVTYLLRDYRLNLREIRRMKLKESFGFDCNCSMCQSETVVGSKAWRLEQRKSSWIAPWSQSMALKTMHQAWDSLCDGRITPGITPSQIIKLLEPTMESQLLVLDKRNVMLLLTAITLVLNYNKIGESQKAVDMFMSLGHFGTCSIIEYGTVADVAEVMGPMCACLLDLGQMEEFRKAFSLTQRFHYMKPSSEALREMLGLTPALTPRQWEEEDKKIEEEGVISEASEQFILFLALMSGTLDNEDYLEALESLVQPFMCADDPL